MLLVALVLLSLVLVTIDFRSEGDGPLDRLRGGITTVFRPVQDGLLTVVRPIGDAFGGVRDVFRTRAENQRLRDEVAALRGRQRSVIDIQRENAELRELLDLRDDTGVDAVAARVVALGPTGFEWTVVIDVGSADGLRRDMPVVNGDGLVGRVIQVEPNAARVLLAIDPNFGAPARHAANGETGTVVGRGGDPMLFQPFDPEAEIEVGDEIVTSAYQSGAFPGGIPIGSVATVGDVSAGLVLDVQVQPFVDFTRIHHVLVVTSEPVAELAPFEDAPDPEFIPPPGPAIVDQDEEAAGDEAADGEAADGGAAEPDDGGEP
ncbi:rod shape-determining protein MreC [Egicoccus halophilus]|uniref:rod shape-determining protein MreC n=1 Tax=Egicoccus halophilus TaxID=1670830 RepID=UPI0013EE4B31|nr:rod shape-determining protein MreC [Egicoccus halophilus]